MNYHKLVQEILNVGEGLLKCGAENFRLEDSLYRMCRSYGFKHSDVFVIPSNMQITVETKEGDIITQIRHIEYRSTDFYRLDKLNDLCRYICAHTPDVEEIHGKYREIMEEKRENPVIKYVSCLFGATGFAIFFGSDRMDAVVAMLVSVLMVATGNWLEKHEKNLFTYNLILSFLAEVVILGCTSIGFGHHPDRIMIGCIMVLISALGLTNGIRDLLLCDFISGLLNIMNAILGAAGIAVGVALALMLMHGESAGVLVMNTSIIVQLISCTVACVGFAYMFKIRGKQVMYAGVGAFFTWGLYALVYRVTINHLLATICGAIFVGFYAFVAARINKAPSTIFLTAAVVPLLPGPHLYYLMDASMKKDVYATYQESWTLFETSLAIAFGLLVVDVAMRVFMHIFQYEYFVSKKNLR